MDKRLEHALDFANKIDLFYQQKDFHFKKFKDSCIYYYQGSTFTVNKELISFCTSLTSLQQKNVIILDDFDTPTIINDVKKFLDEVLHIYSTSMNEYYTEYNKLKINHQKINLADIEDE